MIHFFHVEIGGTHVYAFSLTPEWWDIFWRIQAVIDIAGSVAILGLLYLWHKHKGRSK